MTNREQFQFLLWLLAMSNLVLYLGVLILAFFHTARQQAQQLSSPPAPATQGEAATKKAEAKEKRSPAMQGEAATKKSFVSATSKNATGAGGASDPKKSTGAEAGHLDPAPVAPPAPSPDDVDKPATKTPPGGPTPPRPGAVHPLRDRPDSSEP